MKITVYPTLQEALELHRQLIEQHGGTSGVRDLGLLASALARPQSGYYPSLSAQAAALLQSLALNHPFVDGNKRVAYAAAKIFLKLNGLELKVDPQEGESFLVDDVIAGKAELDTITEWIERRLTTR
jgi:death-on-curing protein